MGPDDGGACGIMTHGGRVRAVSVGNAAHDRPLPKTLSLDFHILLGLFLLEISATYGKNS